MVKVFQNLCVQVYNIISFITVTAEKIQTAMLHCQRFCNPYQDQKINLAYLLDFAPLKVFTCISVKLTKPLTLEIFMECYCIPRKKPVRHKKTKPQMAMAISL